MDRYPDSPQVALALANILECQKLRVQAKLGTEADVEKYFQDLAKKYEAKASTRSKILFTLASYTFEKDQKKAITQMAGAYNEKLQVRAGRSRSLWRGAHPRAGNTTTLGRFTRSWEEITRYRREPIRPKPPARSRMPRR